VSRTGRGDRGWVGLIQPRFLVENDSTHGVGLSLVCLCASVCAVRCVIGLLLMVTTTTLRCYSEEESARKQRRESPLGGGVSWGLALALWGVGVMLEQVVLEHLECGLQPFGGISFGGLRAQRLKYMTCCSFA